MNDYFLKSAAALLCIMAFFAIIGWAGDIDFTDQCIMSKTTPA